MTYAYYESGLIKSNDETFNSLRSMVIKFGETNKSDIISYKWNVLRLLLKLEILMKAR